MIIYEINENMYLKSSFAKQITLFFNNSQKSCFFSLCILINLNETAVGCFFCCCFLTRLKNNKKKQLTNTIKHNQNMITIKNMIFENFKKSVICFCKNSSFLNLLS